MNFWWKYQDSKGDAIMDSTIYQIKTVNDSFKEVQCSIEFNTMKKKIYHSIWKEIDVKMTTSPPPHYSEIVENYEDTISKLREYFGNKKLWFVCIDGSTSDDCNFSFYN